jgi:hypothetical protein
MRNQPTPCVLALLGLFAPVAGANAQHAGPQNPVREQAQTYEELERALGML